MKVKYILQDMDEIKNKMLEADWNSYRWSLVLSAKKVYEKLEKGGHLNKMVNWSKNIQIQKEMIMGRAIEIVDNIDNIMTYDIRVMDETTTELTVWMNKDYFIAEDMVKAKMGKTGKKLIKILITRQSLLNQWREGIRETYTHRFTGEVIEDDGEALKIRT